MVGELLLNHTPSKLDQAYIQTHADTQKRQALDNYHQWLGDRGLNTLMTEIEARQRA
jgi:hypothetical protein